MPECPFCAIVAGKAPARKVHEDPVSLAFLDLYPVVPGHTLVVTRQHVPLLTDIDPAQWNDLVMPFMKSAYAIARKMKKGLGCSHVTMLLRGQRVPHVHMHLVPSWPDRKHLLDLTLQLQDYCQPRLKPAVPESELDTLADRIRSAPVR
ncbi:MAG: HIT family protein [bacterium]